MSLARPFPPFHPPPHLSFSSISSAAAFAQQSLPISILRPQTSCAEKPSPPAAANLSRINEVVSVFRPVGAMIDMSLRKPAPISFVLLDNRRCPTKPLLLPPIERLHLLAVVAALSPSSSFSSTCLRLEQICHCNVERALRCCRERNGSTGSSGNESWRWSVLLGARRQGR